MNMTKNQIQYIFNKQAQLNETMGADNWLEQTEGEMPFTVATIVELVEAIQHLCYKWWSNQDKDLDQARMEIVDMVHFITSFGIRKFGPDAPNYLDAGQMLALEVEWVIEGNPLAATENYLIDQYEDNTDGFFRFESSIRNSRWHSWLRINKAALACLEVDEDFDKGYDANIAYAMLWAALFEAAKDLDLTPKDIYLRYVGKSVLNKFRMDNGYKTHGVAHSVEEYRANPEKYLKTWYNKEDNEHLTQYLYAIPDATEDQILKRLHTDYTAVKAEALK